MKKSSLYLILAVALVVAAISLYWGYNKQPDIINRVDTVKTVIHDTITKDTTIYEKQIVPKEVIKKKVDTLYLKDGKDTLLVTEDKYFNKSLVMGLDTADVEIHTQGINTSLEELKMRLRLHQVNTTETVEIIKYVDKKKRFIDRFHIGLQVGYGLGLKNRDFEPYVGIGGSFDL